MPACARFWGTNSFWRHRLTDVRGWDDFERLPLTTKSEQIDDQQTHPPYGTNLTHPLDRYVRMHQTSGSSGSHPLRRLDTAESWEWWLRIWSDHVYTAAGILGVLHLTDIHRAAIYNVKTFFGWVANSEDVAIALREATRHRP